jgi:DNA replication protein DnaC
MVKYISLHELLNDLAVARGEGIYKQLIKKIRLLILDEWLLTPLFAILRPKSPRLN